MNQCSRTYGPGRRSWTGMCENIQKTCQKPIKSATFIAAYQPQFYLCCDSRSTAKFSSRWKRKTLLLWSPSVLHHPPQASCAYPWHLLDQPPFFLVSPKRKPREANSCEGRCFLSCLTVPSCQAVGSLESGALIDGQEVSGPYRAPANHSCP